ncbi:MAG: atpB [Candidatus Saccharibacteria bacterium]|nr:atpB [Candidatus Saccharibacteria bacterium]
MINTFALTTEPLAAEKLFNIGPLSVTNSMLFGVLIAIFTIGLLLLAAKMTQLHPRSRFAYIIELLVDGIWATAIGTFGDRKTALKHLPLLATLFIFILFCNLAGSGLLPFIGPLQAHTHGGETISLLRPLTTDLNATLSMAILTIGLVQFYAIRQLGIRGHLRHYFAAPLYNPMNLFIGLNEVFGELLRIVTLSMRLFGVIYAGEVLIHAVDQLAGNFGWLGMVPTVLMEIFFSIIQAYVFMMLSATYLSVAIGSEHSEKKAAEAAH